MKLRNFEIIKKAIDGVALDYKKDKEDNNVSNMQIREKEFIGLKKILFSNYNFHLERSIAAKNLVDEDIDSIVNEQDEFELSQRKLYLKNRKNRQFIDIVEKSENLDEFIANESKKKINFVKRNFDRFALSAAGTLALGALGLTFVSCSKSNKDTEETSIEVIQSTEEINSTTEGLKEETIQEEKNLEEVNTALNSVLDTLYIKLNSYPEEYDEDFIINGNSNNNNNNKENKNVNINNGEAIIKYNNDEFKKQEKIESLDPHVSNDSKVTTDTKVINENEVKEVKPVDYNTKTIDNTGVTKDEKVVVEEKEEKIDVITHNIPIDGEKEQEPVDYKPITKDEDFIPAKEKVTIIEVEEETQIDTSIKIDDTEKTNNTNAVEVNKEKEEIVVIEEKEEKVEINTENLPIEGLNNTKRLVLTM